MLVRHSFSSDGDYKFSVQNFGQRLEFLIDGERVHLTDYVGAGLTQGMSGDNDGAIGSSIEPLMPVDYAIGVGTFVPNNAVIMHEDAVKLMMQRMQVKGIKHTTSECTLRGFTCSVANVDPKTATPAEIAKIRKIQIGFQVDGVTGGLAVKDQDKSQK